jgi:hypothetical protein
LVIIKKINIGILLLKTLKADKILISTILILLVFSLSHGFAQPKGAYESDSFKITNMSAIYKGNYLGDTFDIVGMIENSGNKSFNELNLIATLYDKNNSLIDVERTVPLLDIKQQGDISPFKFVIRSNASLFDHYVIQIAGR